MPEPITMVTVAAVSEAGTAVAEGTAAAGVAAGGNEVAGGLAAIGETAGVGSIGKSAEAFVYTLKADAPAVAETMLGRAQASGAELTTAMGKGTGMEVGRVPLGRGAETATSGAQGFDPARWLDWKLTPGERIGPQAVAERFRPLREGGNLESYVRNLCQRDAGFRHEMDRRMQQLREARTPADRDAAIQQVRKSTAGKLGESITTDGFRPFFETFEVQRRVETLNGTTFVDCRLTGAKNPLVLGRGHAVSEGGNLAIEVKTGQPAYLESEIQHIAERQVQGHLGLGDRSIVVVSRDVYAMEGERAARDTVDEAGSRVMALLPEKRVMDEALVCVLRERIERA